MVCLELTDEVIGGRAAESEVGNCLDLKEGLVRSGEFVECSTISQNGAVSCLVGEVTSIED